jgi:large subunit ribosomal protein L17
MRHQKKKIQLGRSNSHAKMLMSQLATSLFLYEKIETTVAKAKALRSYSERLITLAKVDNVAHRRRADKSLMHKNALKKLFEVIGPKYKEKAGGYTRIRRTTLRKGDSGEKATISLV